MKGKLNIVVIGITLILLMSAVSATTMISGTIHYANSNVTISGADVTINCDENIQTTTSSATGGYSVNYDSSVCGIESSLTVSAVKGDLYGSSTGTVHSTQFNWLEVGVVDVPMVPEFGVIVGGLTILSAVGIFFFVRKK